MVKDDFLEIIKEYINEMRRQIKIWEDIRKKLVANDVQNSANGVQNLVTDKIAEIVTYLNLKAKTKYRASSKSTSRLIKARLSDGFTVADFKKVIDNKVADWLNDAKMRNYLRPETLFGAKFESYLNTHVSRYKGNKVLIGNTEIERREYTEQQLNALFSALDEED